MKELVLGDATLDREHAELYGLSEQLMTAAPSEFVGILDALRSHAAPHFAAEDADLHLIRDGNAQCHLDEHAAVLKSLDEVRAVLAGDAQPPETKERVARSLAAELLRWLPHHVQEMDAAVASHRSKTRFGGVPVQIARKPK